MLCRTCCKARMKKAFTSGCKNFHHRALQRHVNVQSTDGASGQHLKAISIVPEQRVFPQAAEKQQILRTLMFIGCRKNMSLKQNGVIHQHHSQVTEMTETLAESVGENQLRKSPVFGVICDESCDVANYKNLILYITCHQ